MIVFFKKDGKPTRDITMVEHEVMSPTLPANMEVNERIQYFDNQEMSYVALPYELGGAIFNYRVCMNDKEEFIGLQPIETEKE